MFIVPGNPQTVGYVAEGFDCPGPVLLEAKVLEVKALGKRPGSKEVVRVAQLDVTKWECLAGSVDELLAAGGSAGTVFNAANDYGIRSRS